LEPTFEDYYSVIKGELKKRESLWQLRALPWLDYQDFCQECMVHINKKLHLYNSSRPFLPWLNRVITTQFMNFLRNVYGRNQQPCTRCPLFQEGECGFTQTGIPNKTCCFFSKWVSSHKQRATQILLPVTMENHQQEVFSMPDESFDYMTAKKHLEDVLKTKLSNLEWVVYDLLYIKNLSEAQVIHILGFTTERGRKNGGGSKRLSEIHKLVVEKARDCLINHREDFDL
jgi:RNA polymerase sigma factor (sigma-70 family)